MKETFTFFGFINFALNLTERGLLIDLKHKFRRSNFYFEPLDISFDYFQKIDLIGDDEERCLWFGKDDFLIAITKDKFEYKRLNKARSSWIVKKRLKRKKGEPLNAFLKSCAMLLEQLLIDIKEDY